MRSTVIEGYWKDTGNVDDMLEVNRTVLEGVLRRIDGEVDAASETVGRVVIEKGARNTLGSSTQVSAMPSCRTPSHPPGRLLQHGSQHPPCRAQ